MFKSLIIQLGPNLPPNLYDLPVCVLAIANPPPTPTWQVIVTENLHGVASLYPQALATGAHSTNMTSVMYSCVRAFLAAAALFGFLSLP